MNDNDYKEVIRVMNSLCYTEEEVEQVIEQSLKTIRKINDAEEVSKALKEAIIKIQGR